MSSNLPDQADLPSWVDNMVILLRSFEPKLIVVGIAYGALSMRVPGVLVLGFVPNVTLPLGQFTTPAVWRRES